VSSTPDKDSIRVWDLPTRLFHWLLVVLVLAMIVTGKIGGNLMDWHGRCGLAIVGLIAFRLVWGVAGTTYARFVSFFPTPNRLRAYLRGVWKEPGHNPLGALSVLALLALLTFQAATGLVGNDDIAFRGPLFDLVGKTLSDRLSGLHKLSANFLYVLVLLHIGAILFYVHVKKDNLVKPMLTGRKKQTGKDATGGGMTSLVIALLFSAIAVYGASGVWQPPPPTPAPAATPNW
jgi:cytochrome b